jgi:ATP-dependent Zn protease
MDTTPWWISLLVSWIPFIALIFVWIILSRSIAKGRGPWGLHEAQVNEMKRTNELLERIAVALEKRAAPGA